MKTMFIMTIFCLRFNILHRFSYLYFNSWKNIILYIFEFCFFSFLHTMAQFSCGLWLVYKILCISWSLYEEFEDTKEVIRVGNRRYFLYFFNLRLLITPFDNFELVVLDIILDVAMLVDI